MDRLQEEENKKYQDKPTIISMDDRNKKFLRMEKVNYEATPSTRPDIQSNKADSAQRLYDYA